MYTNAGNQANIEKKELYKSFNSKFSITTQNYDENTKIDHLKTRTGNLVNTLINTETGTRLLLLE